MYLLSFVILKIMTFWDLYRIQRGVHRLMMLCLRICKKKKEKQEHFNLFSRFEVLIILWFMVYIQLFIVYIFIILSENLVQVTEHTNQQMSLFPQCRTPGALYLPGQTTPFLIIINKNDNNNIFFVNKESTFTQTRTSLHEFFIILLTKLPERHHRSSGTK